MPDESEQQGEPPRTPNNRPRSKHVRTKSESTDSLIVSSIPIFIMEDNDTSTDEDEVSGQESGGGRPMSESARMEVEEWIDVSEDREETPRAGDGAEEGDETVLLGSPSRGRDSIMDDGGTPRAAGKSNDVNDILADPFAGEDYSKGEYKPLPGLFGEMIHYGERRYRDSSRSVVLPASVHQDTDMTGASVNYSQSDTPATAHVEDDTPKYHNLDEFWMENLLSLPWVSDDMTMIFDAESKKLVPMPRRRLERKKLVIDLYSFLIKGVWLVQLAAVGDWIQDIIPTKLWWDVFTEKESEDLQEAMRKKLYYDIITRAITVAEEWRLRYGFPKVPESVEEVLDAKEEARERYEMKCTILTKASEKSVDRWVKYVFQGIMEADNMDQVLGSELEGIRQRVISKLTHVTELPFSDCWTVERCLKEPLGNRRKMEDVIEEQLNGLFQNLNIHDE